MSPPSEPPSSEVPPNALSKAASDLNNLLQIMSSASALMDKAGEGGESGEEHRAMLRATIERAEQLAAELVQQAGGPKEKIIANPEPPPFGKAQNGMDLPTVKECILLVDDEQMALTLVERVLTEAGYHVVTAQSGFECLDIFRLRPYSFSLILLDLSMPFLDGEETFQRLRGIRPDMPVILCTGFIQQDRLDRLMNSGLMGFLRKPLPPDEILSFVRSILQSIKYSGGNVSPVSVPAVI
jgi:CheY-like chemotaxis protein